MKYSTECIVFLMVVIAFLLGFTLRGDLIYSGMFKNTVEVKVMEQ